MKKLSIVILIIFIAFIGVFLLSDKYTFEEDKVLISYYYDGESHDTAPSKGEYEVVQVNCEKVEGVWDRYEWKLKLRNMNGKAKCDLNFFQLNAYKEDILGSAPELYTSLVPVIIDDDGKVKVADITTEWYSYANHKWANAVIVNNKYDYFDSNGMLKSSKIGSVISMDEILQMYVWIPRYRYKLWNAENGISDPQMIEVEFESIYDKKQEGSQNGQWLTHPAFTFGTTELAGFWAAKFEPSSTLNSSGVASQYTCEGGNCDVAATIRIKPNVNSLRNQTFTSMMYISRALEYVPQLNLQTNEIDTHAMKNIEWGAIAYLTYSKYGRYIDQNTCIGSGCNIWSNTYYNSSTKSSMTGCGGNNQVDQASTNCLQWNSSGNGGKTSTTGNMYGIYDLGGGAWEYVSSYKIDDSILTFEDLDQDYEINKYLDIYKYANRNLNFYKALHLGDATKEILQYTPTGSCGEFSWYKEYMCIGQIFARGGSYGARGLFNFGSDSGEANENGTWRIVLSIED